MAIYLITGLPGSGKTLYTVSRLVKEIKAESEKQQAEKIDRPVYQNGIKDLKLPWFELADPLKWFECPAGSIIVIDECQRYFRTRPTGSTVPRAVAEMETHRHHGFDLVLITQGPGLLDVNVRRLVNDHRHVVRRRWSKGAATVHFFQELVDRPDKGVERQAHGEKREVLKYRPEDFAVYKSAEVHTHTKRTPKFFYVAGVGAVVAIAAVYYSFGWIREHTKKGGDLPANLTAPPKSAPTASSGPVPSQAGTKANQATYLHDYLSDRAPVIPTKPWTAMRYKDLVGTATNVPLPQGCAESEDKKRCVCYTNEATRLQIPDDQCRLIVAGGFYLDTAPGIAPEDNTVSSGPLVAPATALLPSPLASPLVPISHEPMTLRPTVAHPLTEHHGGLPRIPGF